MSNKFFAILCLASSINFNVLANTNDNTSHGLDTWVEDAELNWKANDFGDFNDQQVSIDVSLKNSAQLQAEESILGMGKEKVDIKQSIYHQNQLLQRFQQMIGLIEQQKRSSLLKHQRGIGQAELNNWKASVLSDQFRPDKLQQADISLDEIWANELDNKAAIKRYQNNTSNNQSRLGAKNTLNLQQVLNTMQRILESGEYERYNPYIRKARLEMNLAQKQQQREYAKESFGVDSIKLQYDNKDEAFGASVGIRLPITKNSFETKLKKQEIYYSTLGLNNTRSRIVKQLRNKQFSVLRLQDEWRSNLKVMNKLAKRMMRIRQTGNTQLILDLQSEQLIYRKRQNEISIQALKEYIAFLHHAGMFAMQPSRNWLQVGAPLL